MNDTPPRHRTIPEYVAIIEESQPGRYRIMLRDNPEVWTSSNKKLLDQRMRLAIGTAFHGGDGWCFEVRYLMGADGGTAMISRVGPVEPLPPDSKALVLGRETSEHGRQMAAWLRARNAEDERGRHLAFIIEDHDGGSAGLCNPCGTQAPCPTHLNLVMHYMTLLGEDIVRPD